MLVEQRHNAFVLPGQRFVHALGAGAYVVHFAVHAFYAAAQLVVSTIQVFLQVIEQAFGFLVALVSGLVLAVHHAGGSIGADIAAVLRLGELCLVNAIR